MRADRISCLKCLIFEETCHLTIHADSCLEEEAITKRSLRSVSWTIRAERAIPITDGLFCGMGLLQITVGLLPNSYLPIPAFQRSKENGGNSGSCVILPQPSWCGFTAGDIWLWFFFMCLIKKGPTHLAGEEVYLVFSSIEEGPSRLVGKVYLDFGWTEKGHAHQVGEVYSGFNWIEKGPARLAGEVYSDCGWTNKGPTRQVGEVYSGFVWIEKGPAHQASKVYSNQKRTCPSSRQGLLGLWLNRGQYRLC